MLLRIVTPPSVGALGVEVLDGTPRALVGTPRIAGEAPYRLPSALMHNGLIESRCNALRMKTLSAIKWSIVAGLVVAVLGVLSIGFLGLGLYYLTYPIHYPLLGDIDTWQGADLFWPAIIVAGMLWSLCFPAAGLVDLGLERRGASRTIRVACYLAILWLGAGLIWLLVATGSGFRFAA
ncbi:MAG: hypothetical protein IT477_01370 [Rhodanobacteraceae bacterium]|nr:hypothetical protein [Rhodanobacteraceae bacterium]MDL1870466.1 hypothetical protein [Gammaproteobacteria bacterium PRO6]